MTRNEVLNLMATVLSVAAIAGAILNLTTIQSLRVKLAEAQQQRDAAWEMYRILADEKNVLEAE